MENDYWDTLAMRINSAVADPARAVALRPRLLSLRETAVLAGILEKEKWIRNDITHGILSSAHVIRLADARLCFNWPDVYAFAAIYGNKHFDDSALRKVAFEKVHVLFSGANMTTSCAGELKLLCANIDRCASVEIDNYIDINFRKVCKVVSPRVDVYAEGLGRVEENEGVLGGAAVFRDSRVSVSHIGKMAERGVSVAEIMEDYPVTAGDVEFARLYYCASPPRGRPKASGEPENARVCT